MAKTDDSKLHPGFDEQRRLAELRRRVEELESEFLTFRNVCSSRETHREFYLGRASGFDSAADHIRAILDATEPPQPPPARDPDMLGSAGRYQPSPRPVGDSITDDTAAVKASRPRWAASVEQELADAQSRATAAEEEVVRLRGLVAGKEAARDRLCRLLCLDRASSWERIAFTVSTETERLRGELSEAGELAARLRRSALELTAERDAAREVERRVQQKLTDLFEQWAHKPTNGPHEYGRRQGVLSAAETIRVALTPPTGGESNG